MPVLFFARDPGSRIELEVVEQRQTARTEDHGIFIIQSRGTGTSSGPPVPQPLRVSGAQIKGVHGAPAFILDGDEHLQKHVQLSVRNRGHLEHIKINIYIFK